MVHAWEYTIIFGWEIGFWWDCWREGSFWDNQTIFPYNSIFVSPQLDQIRRSTLDDENGKRETWDLEQYDSEDSQWIGWNPKWVGYGCSISGD